MKPAFFNPRIAQYRYISSTCQFRCTNYKIIMVTIAIGSITAEQVLQAVDLAAGMNKDGDLSVDVPNYVDENVSTKVVKLIQSYTGIINKMVWRK